MVRGIERRAIFVDGADRQDFVDRLAGLCRETATAVYAWSLLPNHAHLLARSATAGLSALMRRLLTGYAVRFNHRHRRSGHLFHNRFKSILVEEEPYFLELVRYVHLNPLRASVITTLEELDAYRWSGHSRLLGTVDDGWQAVEPVLERFGSRVGRARRAYRAFVAEGLRQGRRPDLEGGGLKRSRKGWQPAQEVRRGRESWAFDERILGSGEFVQEMLAEVDRPRDGRPGLAETSDLPLLIRKLVQHLNCSVEELRARRWQSNTITPRSVVSYVAVVHCGQSLRAVAAALGVSSPTVLRDVRRGADTLGRLDMTVDRLLG